MAKRSRARTARRTAERERRRRLTRGLHAEARGRAVPPTVEGYREVLRQRGDDAVAEALIARQGQRFERITRFTVPMQSMFVPHLTCLPSYDRALRELAARSDRAPFDPGSSLTDHLGWGLDSAAAAVRFLLCMQPIGAAVIARSQMEFWAGALGSVPDFAASPLDARALVDPLWDVPSAALPPDRLFAQLSELLHGRGPMLDLVWLDVSGGDRGPSADEAKNFEVIADSVTANLLSIRRMTAEAATSAGRSVLGRRVLRQQIIAPITGWFLTHDKAFHLFPLTPGLVRQPNVVEPLLNAATRYAPVVRGDSTHAGTLPPPELWPVLSLIHRRARAVKVAIAALQWEQRARPEEDTDEGVEGFLLRLTFSAEMSGMIALWLRDCAETARAADALAVCASALRSAVWLWLEDDPRSMGCLRSAVEQLARARTWRTKPAKAQRIETKPQITPRDWLEASGWRRLNVLSRALSEFAHGATGIRARHAREILIALVPDDHPMRRHSGRVHTLEVVSYLLIVECARWMESIDDAVGQTFWRLGLVDRARADIGIEPVLALAHEQSLVPLRAVDN